MISDLDLLSHTRADEDEIETLRRLERAAIAHIQKRTGRYIGVENVITEYIPFRGWPIQLANEPTSLTSFKSWDGSAFSDVDATSYYLQGAFLYSNSTSVPTLTIPSRYQVVYNAGYPELNGNPDEWDAPEDIRQAVLLYVGTWYEHREGIVVGESSSALDFTIDALLNPHTRVSVG